MVCKVAAWCVNIIVTIFTKDKVEERDIINSIVCIGYMCILQSCCVKFLQMVGY